MNKVIDLREAARGDAEKLLAEYPENVKSIIGEPVIIHEDERMSLASTIGMMAVVLLMLGMFLFVLYGVMSTYSSNDFPSEFGAWIFFAIMILIPAAAAVFFFRIVFLYFVQSLYYVSDAGMYVVGKTALHSIHKIYFKFADVERIGVAHNGYIYLMYKGGSYRVPFPLRYVGVLDKYSEFEYNR
ncbi:MAG: hypothetical protein HOG49_15710 [Candidatus Scalindua sp.]|jgi:hypothetical protein|nr:hypothetical protein [Candidatus Scalindua sp.]